jgi:hypothetical protein
MRQSLGTAVFAGMLGVTIFGLIFTPTFYVLSRAVIAPDGLPARIARRLGLSRRPAEPEGEAKEVSKAAE